MERRKIRREYRAQRGSVGEFIMLHKLSPHVIIVGCIIVIVNPKENLLIFFAWMKLNLHCTIVNSSDVKMESE